MKTPEQLVAIYTDELCDQLTKTGVYPNERRAIFRIEDMRMAFLTGCKRAVQSGVIMDTNSIDTNISNNSTGWISVKDRLPEMKEVALVFSKSTYLNVAHRVVDDKGWCWSTPFMSIAPHEITHWMSLPAPPKEEK